MVKFFKFLVMLSPLLKAVLDYHCIGEVTFKYPEPDLEDTTRCDCECAHRSTQLLTAQPNATQVEH